VNLVVTVVGAKVDEAEPTEETPAKAKRALAAFTAVEGKLGLFATMVDTAGQYVKTLFHS
jgi:hypothetical protein